MPDVSEAFLDDLKPLLGDEVALVQQKDVAVNHLGPANFRVQNDVVEVFCIDQGDDRIQAGFKNSSLPRKVMATGRGSARPVVSTMM